MYVGTFMTSLDMAGFSLSVLVLDNERIAALDADTQVCPSHLPFWPCYCVIGEYVLLPT